MQQAPTSSTFVGSRRRGSSDGRSKRRRLPGFVAAALMITFAAVSATPGVASATSATPLKAGVTYYAIGKPVCKAPKQHHSTCFAERRVLVKKGTPGAHAFRVAAGASLSAAAAGPAATIGPAGGLTPSDLSTAYGFSSTATGAGQTVAIVDAYNDPDINSDLQTFDAQYGLATCSTGNGCLQVVNQTGGIDAAPQRHVGLVRGGVARRRGGALGVPELQDHPARGDGQLQRQSRCTAVNEAVTLHATEISNSFGGAREPARPPPMKPAYNHPGIVITAVGGRRRVLRVRPARRRACHQPAEAAGLLQHGRGGRRDVALPRARRPPANPRPSGTTTASRTIWRAAARAVAGRRRWRLQHADRRPRAGRRGLATWASTAAAPHRLVADVAADADPFTGFDIYDSFDCGSSECPTRRNGSRSGGPRCRPRSSPPCTPSPVAHTVSPIRRWTLYGHLGSIVALRRHVGGNGYCDGEGAAACGDPNTLGLGSSTATIRPPERRRASATGPATPCQATTARPASARRMVSVPSPSQARPRRSAAPRRSPTASRARGRSRLTDPFPGGKVTELPVELG